MANTSEGGFRWRRSKDGAARQPVEVFNVADNYGTAIYKGDPVKLVAAGSIEVAAAGDTDILGIADGVEQYYDGSVVRKGNYLPANTRWGSSGTNFEQRSRVRVIPARGQVFEVDLDDSAAAYDTEAEVYNLIGENCDHIASAAGSNQSGRSGYELDASTHVTTAAQWRVVEISRRLDNDYTAANIKVLVEVNESGQPSFTTSGV